MLQLVDPEKRPIHWYMDVQMPVDDLWAIFADYRNVGEWWPDKNTRFDFIGDGIGMIRNIYPPGGLMISQRLDAIDENQRTITATFLNSEEYGMKDFQGTMKATDLGNGWSRLTYMATTTTLLNVSHSVQIAAAEGYLAGFYASLKVQLEGKGIKAGASGRLEVKEDA